MLWLLLATGFTGALTLVFAARWLGRVFGLLPTAAAHFSPDGGCTAAVVAAVRKARREVLVQAFALTSPAVVEALVQAHRRKVRVTVLLDAAHEKEAKTAAGQLWEAGVTVVVDKRPAHSKVIIIDGRTLITGSFDFTPEAEEKRGDNLLVLRRHFDLVDAYRDHFLKLEERCRPAEKPTVAEKPAVIEKPTPKPVAVEKLPAAEKPPPKPAVVDKPTVPPKPAVVDKPPPVVIEKPAAPAVEKPAPAAEKPAPPPPAPKPPPLEMIPLSRSAAPPALPPAPAPTPLGLEPIPLRRAA
jgi:PLD-like domain